MSTSTPFLTVAVPVYGDVPFLPRCLKSIVSQTLPDIDILVVDDSGSGDSRAQKQLNSFLKTLPREQQKRIRCVRHKNNMGCFETRRTAALNARGEYVMYADSDDELASSGACRILYETAQQTGTDVVQYAANLLDPNSLLKDTDRINLERGLAHAGYNSSTDIPLWEHIIVLHDLPTFVWTKLVRREVLLDAFNEIPRLYCFNKEDIVFSFFLGVTAQSYTVIGDRLYNYYIGGETSAPGAKTIRQWSNMCSASSGFTAEFLWLRHHAEGHPEYAALENALKPMYFSAVRECLLFFDRLITPDQYDEVTAIINDSWGEKVVANVRKAMQK